MILRLKHLYCKDICFGSVCTDVFLCLESKSSRAVVNFKIPRNSNEYAHPKNSIGIKLCMIYCFLVAVGVDYSRLCASCLLIPLFER